MKKLVLLCSIISTTMLAMHNSGDGSHKNCCELYSHKVIVNSNNSKTGIAPLVFLALTCHEYSEEEIRKRAQIADVDSYYSRHGSSRMCMHGTNLKYGVPSGYPEGIIRKKFDNGCQSSSCKVLLDIITAYEKKEQQEAIEEKKLRQKRIEEEYQRLLNK